MTVIVAVVAATIFLIYASTDPGPPVDGAIVGAVLAAIALAIIHRYRALGVPRATRG